MLKPLLALALLLPCTPTAAPEELRIPAATGYLIPDPDAVPVSPARPIRPFVATGAGIAWFGDFGRAGDLEVAVAIRAERGDTLRLHLDVGSSRLEAVLVGTGEEVRVALGRVTLPATGYHRFLLTADGRRSAAAEVRALLLDGAPLPQAHFNLDPRRNAASVHLRFPVDTGAVVTGFYNEVTAVDDPVTTYYMATGFARGYFGMQVNSPTERRIIFSVWDAASGTNAKDRSTVASENYTQLMAKGDGVVAEVFGNEGTGGHSHLVYPWKTGSRQRFFVTAQLEGDATIYSGYWFHPDKQAWVLIASFRAAKDGQGLRRLYAFSENFGGSTGHLRRKALFGPQWIRLANGQWQELTTATFSHDATGKENRGDRFMGVEEGRFFLSHGGFVPGWTTSGASFTRAATGVPPVVNLPAEEVPFRVSRSGWDAEVLGNHRAVVRVATTGDAARVTIPWRRRDDHPEAKRIVVVDSASGRRIGNVRTDAINREHGELIFEPTSGPGRYDIYYLPFKSGGRSNYPNITYLPPDSTADAAWLRAIAERRAMPRAAVEAIEAVDTLSSFFPMEVIATAAETERVRRDHAGDGFLLFPEDRLYPIRMTKDLPARWVLQPPGDSLVGRAARGEYFAFQLGLYALRRQDSVTVRFSDLRGPTGAIIPAARLNSLNTSGVDWAGRPMAKRVDVAAGMVQALWCGVDVPLGARPGRYRGRATVRGSDGGERTVQLVLDVASATAVRGGADEPWKQTRLAWLNSTLAQRNDVIAPYIPLVVRGDTVSLLGRRLVVGRSGLPADIATYFTEEMTGFSTRPKAVLAAPIEFVVDGGGAGTSSGARFDRREPGTVGWHATTTAPGWTMRVQGALEFDGYLSYRIALVARTPLSLADIRMVVPFAPRAAKYMMGLGQKGGRRPASLDWRWDVATKNQDGAWIGDVNAGLYFSLRGDNYVRPLNTNFYLQKPLNLPPSWGNGGAGGISVRETASAVRVTSFSGPRTLAAGDTLWFDVVGLITPFHPIDTDFQWSHRFYHRYAPVDTVLATSANVVNIHHANAINPYINYPFIAHDAMRAYIDSAHARGLTVKIYDTVRELSNRAWEIFPMRSLGHEIFTPGKGGGSSWPQEHLVDDYIAGWYVPELKDAAIINSGMSRWHNYYIEGVSWLVRTVGIDGLYLDDVAFDRVTMKRLKRVLVQDGHPGIIDLHSANQYNKNDGFINSGVLYLEHFPYLNRLWFGEYFDYEKNSADFYLTEVSGIPFGLMGEMLQDGGNPWRGMLYGMTNRMPWDKNADPRPIWALWDRVGMQGTKMIGYWVASTPIRTGREDVLATVYRKPGQALVAVASWADGPVALRLQIDWKALGIDSTRATITAPAVGTLQAEQHYRPGEAIPIQPGKGAFLVVK